MLSSCEYYWEDWKGLFGQRSKDNVHPGGALAAPGTLCTKGTCAQAVGHKAEQRCEAPLSFVWKRGFTLTPFMAMLHSRWVRPVNSTHEQIQCPPPPQGVCPEPDQPASCWPSRCHSSTPLLAPDLSYLTVVESLCLLFACWPSFLLGQHRQLFPWSGKQSFSKGPVYSYWLEGSQSRIKKKITAMCCLASRLVCALDWWIAQQFTVPAPSVSHLWGQCAMPAWEWHVVGFSDICETLKHLTLAICLPLPFQNR